MTASGASGNGHLPDSGNGHHKADHGHHHAEPGNGHLPDSGNGHHKADHGHHHAESGNGRVPHPVSGGPIVQLPTAFGDFVAQAWTDLVTGHEHLAVSSPNPPQDGKAPLVRLHSECLTGDVFGSYRCDCGEQLAYALEMIREHGGTLLYLRGQEGRGIGLANKIKAYALQEAGFDTVEANEQLGLPVDARCYKAAAQVLAEMGLHEVRLLSNNPDKQNRLAKAGVKVVEMVPTEVPSRDQNIRYLQTKKDRMEHRLVLGDHVGGAVPVTSPGSSFDHEQD